MQGVLPDRESFDAAALRVPRVSVLMPVFNGAAYLAESIASVLAQSFGDFELIVVDDGSTDDSARILQAFHARDRRMRVIRQRHAGLVAALRRGCDAARGEFIARLDADDVAHPERLARQVAYLDAHPGIGLVGSAVTLIDAAGRPIGRKRFPCAPRAIARRLFAGENVLAHSTVTARRAALLAAGGYDPFYRHAEDYALWLRMAERCAIANLSVSLVAYRMHPGGTGHRNRIDQLLAARTAMVVARLRRLGLPDPTIASGAPSVALLASLPFEPAERRTTMLDLGQLALDLVHAGMTVDERLASVAAVLSPTTARRTVRDTVAAMLRIGGPPFANPRAARLMAGFGLHLARTGRRGEGAKWAFRAMMRHPLGPAWLGWRVATGVAMRYARRRGSTKSAIRTG